MRKIRAAKSRGMIQILLRLSFCRSKPGSGSIISYQFPFIEHDQVLPAAQSIEDLQGPRSRTKQRGGNARSFRPRGPKRKRRVEGEVWDLVCTCPTVFECRQVIGRGRARACRLSSANGEWRPRSHARPQPGWYRDLRCLYDNASSLSPNVSGLPFLVAICPLRRPFRCREQFAGLNLR